jgi:carboxyl-terminal processing protease
MRLRRFVILQLVVFLCLVVSPNVWAKDQKKKKTQKAYSQYLDFFEKVFKTMQDNYYQPVSRDVYNQFIEDFNTKIYPQLQSTKKSEDFVRWRSSSILIKRLKSSEDIFSEFYPPKPAQEYKQSALATRHDLGIEGKIVAEGYQVTRLEPHADAYASGLREKDILLKIDNNLLAGQLEDKIKEWLNPVENTKVNIHYFSSTENKEMDLTAENKEYFKQTVFMKSVPYPGVLYLEIPHFNKTTGEDLFRFLEFYRSKTNMVGLIIDFRGNPGGPPLAAREISSMFLPGGEDFAYFQKKDQPKQMLDIPKIPDSLHYDGPIVLLLDEKSGSATELFSGVLQKRKRAAIMGRNSAGQVMLKSMFNFDDQSMVLLVTGRGYHPDGTVFSFNGITPDKYFKPNEEDQMVSFAASYIYYLNKKEEKTAQDAHG